MPRPFACGLVTATLLGILVGCNPKPVPEEKSDAGPDNPQAAAKVEKESEEVLPEKELVNEDPGLDGNLLRSGGANARSDSVTGGAIGGTGGNSGAVVRSGATKSRMLREGGGNAAPNPKPQPAGGKAVVLDGHDASNAEKYGTFRENEFRSPLVEALSTFSADVNTASYSNVRRMLTAGALPPRDAVFLAEFVNYFPYQYATPRGDDPVEFNLEMGPCPWNRKHHLVRVGVQASRIEAAKMPPRNLVFLIDTSGSMDSPNRLPLVKQSLALLVDQLGERDRVSLVTYAGSSRVALGPTKGSDKDRIKTAVNELSASGGTNGEGGITKAYELARGTFIEGGVNRVVLCTDGDFNVGVTNHGDLVRMIEEQRRSKVFLTILGFGMGNYKDDVLKDLANHGNGHHAYIDTVDEAKKVFVEQGGALACVAKDVKLQVDFNPARVAAYRLVGYENRLLKAEDFKNDKKDAGDMGSGHQVTVLYEIVPVGVGIDLPGVDKSKYATPAKPDPNAPDEWLTVKMRYKQPEGDTSKELAKVLPGKALGQDLSADFRFAAAAASFGMILRDSQFRGAMTYAGVLEEAQGCVGADPNGHRKEFLTLVTKAKELSTKPAAPEAAGAGQN
ncbi:vWA domain-containing protein [Gemmata sp.]|uniref:vWA domain-containing protein n=1 Tax=Gemmata sp. TaxID=1914242 RepID=UPI003F72CC6B